MRYDIVCKYNSFRQKFLDRPTFGRSTKESINFPLQEFIDRLKVDQQGIDIFSVLKLCQKSKRNTRRPISCHPTNMSGDLSEMSKSCSICAVSDPDRLLTKFCCINDICDICLTKWIGQNVNIGTIPCMICHLEHDLMSVATTVGKSLGGGYKDYILTIISKRRNFTKKNFYLDYSSLAHFKSSLLLIFTSRSCDRCGIRIDCKEGCSRVYCPNCGYHNDWFWRLNPMELLSPSIWIGNISSVLWSVPADIMRRIYSQIGRLLEFLLCVILSTIVLTAVACGFMVIQLSAIFAT